MSYITQCPNKPFTELFSSIRFVSPLTPQVAANKKNELISARGHVENSIEVLLRGWQSLMDVFCMLESNNITIVDQVDFWAFLSSIGNLIEALNHFRNDVDYLLEQNFDSIA